MSRMEAAVATTIGKRSEPNAGPVSRTVSSIEMSQALTQPIAKRTSQAT